MLACNGKEKKKKSTSTCYCIAYNISMVHTLLIVSIYSSMRNKSSMVCMLFMDACHEGTPLMVHSMNGTY